MIPLSPVDYLFCGPGSQPITFAFSYAVPLPGQQLREGLQKVMHDFPLIGSRLVRTSECDLAFVRRGVIPEIEFRASGQTFDPAAGTAPYIEPVRTAEELPLVRFSVTRTPTGSVFAASISHALADGFSYFHFLSSWARVCRGERFIPPSHDRTFLDAMRNQSAGQMTEADLLNCAGVFAGEQRSEPPPAPARRFAITGEQLKRELDDARRASGTPLTENDIVVAFLWKRLLSGTAGGETFVTCPVDIRRVLPGCPRTYFGCALAFATARAPAELIPELSVGRLAGLVKDAAVRGDRASESLSVLERFRKNNGLKAMERIHLRHPERGLIVTNLTRMPILDVDFGPGPPSSYVPYVGLHGGAAIVSAPDGLEIILTEPQAGR